MIGRPGFGEGKAGEAVVGGLDSLDAGKLREVSAQVRADELGEGQVGRVRALQEDREGGLGAPGGGKRAEADPAGEADEQDYRGVSA